MMERLRQHLEIEEGCEYRIYLCSKNVLTFGIGHAIKETDREYGWPVDTEIPAERVAEAFEQDVQTCLKDCRWLHPDFDTLPQDAQITIASLCFQLGLPRYQKFRLHHAAIEAREWREAAAQLRDSNLYRQTTNRTERHARRLESIV